MFKHNLTCKLNKQRANSKGLYPLRIRATVKRVVSYYPTGVLLREDQWNDEKQEVVNHKNKLLLNATISQKVAQIESRFLEAGLRGEQPLKFSAKKSANDFIPYCREQIKRMQAKDKKATTKHKNSYLVKLEGFMPSIPFKSINLKLLHAYEDYCRGLGNIENTVWSSMKFVKTMLRCAVSDGLIDRKIVDDYKMPKYVNPEREHLTLSEVDKIEAFVLEAPIERLRNVADWFLFACYTGFRYEDVKRFSPSLISNGKILMQTHKTGGSVTLAIHPRLQKVIARMKPGVYTDQKCNDYLKLIAAGAGINKHLTMHIARHSFAVIHLEMGGSMESLSKLLGHTKISTTQIYGKITNKALDAEVKKVWG